MIRFIALIFVVLAGMASAQDEYRAKSGDVVIVEVLEDSSLNRSVQILPDGRFSFPFAGSLTGAGRTVGEIAATITTAIAPNFATPPTVFVSIQPDTRSVAGTGSAGSSRSIDVYFLGEVNQPGLRELKSGTTMLQAIGEAGGLTRFAATKRIQLRRGTTVSTLNYKALSDGAALPRNTPLQDGDVILVPERRLFE